MADIQRYLNLVTSQHQDKPKFMAWLAAPLGILDDAATLANNFNTHFDQDLAVGVQLDTLGDIVGVNRTVSYQPLDGSSPVLGDDTFRKLIKAKISKNQWDGTTEKIYELWENVFPNFGLQVIDHQDMSMTALMTGQIDSSTQQLIANSYIVPKPQGVFLTIAGLSDSAKVPHLGMLASTTDFVTVSMEQPT